MSEGLVSFLNVFTGIRKTIVMMLLMIIGIIFRLKGLIDGQQFVDLLKNTVLGFFGANGVEHFSSMIKAHLESKSTVAVIDSDSSNT